MVAFPGYTEAAHEMRTSAFARLILGPPPAPIKSGREIPQLNCAGCGAAVLQAPD